MDKQLQAYGAAEMFSRKVQWFSKLLTGISREIEYDDDRQAGR